MIWRIAIEHAAREFFKSDLGTRHKSETTALLAAIFRAISLHPILVEARHK
jgi:hypothetical protein